MNAFERDPSVVRNILMIRNCWPVRPDLHWMVCKTNSLTAFSKGYAYAVYDTDFDFPLSYLTAAEAELCFGWALRSLLDLNGFARAKRPFYKTPEGNLRGVTVNEALAEWDKVQPKKPKE